MNFKFWVYVLSAVSLFGLGWLAKPDQVRTEIKTVEVVKEVKVKDKVETRVITERPDGTRITEERTETRTETNRDRNLKREEVNNPVVPQWTVGAYRSVNGPIYTVTVDRRILGNVFIGIYGRTEALQNNELGFGLRMEF